jgi:hypothetical protein
MTRQNKIFFGAGLAMLASLVALGFNVRQGVPAANGQAKAKTLSSAAEPTMNESTGSTSKVDYLAATAAEAARFSASAAKFSTQLNQTSYQASNTSDAGSSVRDHGKGKATAEPVDNEREVYQVSMPLAFLDYTSVLPDTPEVAATIQKLRQDFIDSTGAATADPTDPNYAAQWNEVQPTADEIFCSIFGTQACNALSIVRRQQLGHF